MKSRQWYLVQKVGNPRKQNVIKVKEPKEVQNSRAGRTILNNQSKTKVP
jgi:hypothetical protein